MQDKLLEMVPVPLSYMTIMIREITQNDQEVAELLQGTGIEPSSLLDPDCTITLAQQLKLFEKAAKQDAGIALALGLKANILTHGPLGQAMLSSETFRDALKVLCKYAKTRNPVVQYDFKETSNLAVLEFSQMVDLKGARILYTEGSMATVKTFLKFFLAEKFKDINFYFSYLPPTHADLYEELLECPVVFSWTKDQVTFPLEYLDIPMPLAEATALDIALLQCEGFISQAAEDFGVVGRIKATLFELESQFPDLKNMASLLNMTPRTLSRHLNESGYSFQSIVNEVLEIRACHYLINSNKSVKEIASILGYAVVSNFRRAFKSWTGESPNVYQNKHKQS